MTTTTDSLAWWRERAGAHPLLTPEQELTLGRQVQAWQENPDDPRAERRGRRARDRLVAANLRLVITVARRHQRHVSGGCGLEDLIQGGNIGLMRAAEKFDPSRGYKFSTYAYWWISQGVRAVIDRDARTIRMPTTFASKMHAIQSATHSLLLRLGREPTHDEVAAELGIHRSALNALLTIGGRCASLDRLISDSGETTFVEALAAPGNPEDDDEQLQDLRSRIETLPDHLARLVHARYHHQLPPSELAAQERLTPIELRRHLKVAVGILTASCRPSNAPRCQAELISGDQLALFVLPQTERHPGRPRVERRSRELPSMGQVEQGALALV
jgi:RNA polymerase primary sigma factor